MRISYGILFLLSFIQIVNSGELSGTLSNKYLRSPLSNIELIIQNSTKTYTTTSDFRGFFHFEKLPTGLYTLMITSPMYKRIVQRSIYISKKSNLELNIKLTPKRSLFHETPLLEQNLWPQANIYTITPPLFNRYSIFSRPEFSYISLFPYNSTVKSMESLSPIRYMPDMELSTKSNINTTNSYSQKLALSVDEISGYSKTKLNSGTQLIFSGQKSNFWNQSFYYDSLKQSPEFWTLSTRFNRISSKNTLSLIANSWKSTMRDQLSRFKTEGSITSSNFKASISNYWYYIVSTKLDMLLNQTRYNLSTKSNDYNTSLSRSDQSVETNITSKGDFYVDVFRGIQINGGFYITKSFYNINILTLSSTHDLLSLYQDKNTENFGFHLASEIPLLPTLSLKPSIHFDNIRFIRKSYFSPAITFEFIPQQGNLAVTSQFELNYKALPLPILLYTPNNRFLKAEKKYSTAIQIQYLIPSILEIGINGSYNISKDVPIDPAYYNNTIYPNVSYLMLQNIGESANYSISAALSTHNIFDNRLFFSGKYSYSQSYEENTQLPNSSRPQENDQGHSISLTGGCQFTIKPKGVIKRLKSNILLRFLTPIIPIGDYTRFTINYRGQEGTRYTPFTYDVGKKQWGARITDINSKRHPFENVLSFDLERLFVFEHIDISYHIQLLNLSLNKQIVKDVIYDDNQGKKSHLYEKPQLVLKGTIQF